MMPAAGVCVVHTMMRSGLSAIAWVAPPVKSVSLERMLMTSAVLAPAASITLRAAL